MIDIMLFLVFLFITALVGRHMRNKMLADLRLQKEKGELDEETWLLVVKETERKKDLLDAILRITQENCERITIHLTIFYKRCDILYRKLHIVYLTWKLSRLWQLSYRETKARWDREYGENRLEQIRREFDHQDYGLGGAGLEGWNIVTGQDQDEE